MISYSTPHTLVLRQFGGILLSFMLAAVVGWELARDERIALFIIAVVLGLAVLLVRWLWIPALSLFGLLALNNDGVTPLKILFIGVLLLLVIATSGWMTSHKSDPVVQIMAPLVKVSIATLAILALSATVAVQLGTPIDRWARSSTSLFLFSMVPFAALSAWISTSKLQLEKVFVGTASIGAAGYVFTWAENRNFLNTEVSEVLFAAGGSLLALYYYAVTKVVLRQGTPVWTIILAFSLLGLFLTGSRTALLNLLAFVTIPLLVSRTDTQRLGRLLARLAMVVIASGVAILAFVRVASFEVGGIFARYATIDSLLAGDGSDASRLFREQLTIIAWEVFQDYPLVGSGPGINIQPYWERMGWPPIWKGGMQQVPQQLYDTPLLYLAWLGLVGVVLLLFVAKTYVSFSRRCRDTLPANPAAIALQGWMLTMLAASIVAMPLEDKSLFFGAFLLIALAIPADRIRFGETRRNSSTDE